MRGPRPARASGRSVTTSDPSAGRVVVRCRSQWASSRSGKSERTCPPRVSSRRCATSERACPRCSRLRGLPRGRARARPRVGGSAARSASAASAPAVDDRRPHRARPPRHRALHVEAVRGVEHRRVTGIRRRASRSGSSPAASRLRDVVGDAVREDEPLEQRVRGEPVGAVHAGARALPARVEPVDRGAPEQVGLDAAGRVVLGRGDGQQLGRRVEAELAAAGDDRGEALLEEVGAEVAGVEPDVVDVLVAHDVEDRPGDDVARREVGELVPALHDPRARRRRRGRRPRRARASEMSGCWPVEPSPRKSTVGWNCTNSRSVTRAPARSAAAIPSPVATGGLVVEV